MDTSFIYTEPPPPRYEFTPQPDITAYELALCLPLFFGGKDVPAEIERHLKRIP